MTNAKEVWLQLNGKHYSYAQIKSGEGSGYLTEFEKSTLSFCYDWLQGKDHFTLFTSGSTGTPKRITLRREQMEESSRLTSAALNLMPGYHALLCLDTRYIAGQMMLVRSFVTGMNIVAVEPSANPFEKIGAGMKIDFAALVPYQLHAIVNTASSKEKLNALKVVIVGGAAIEPSLSAMLGQVTCPLFATYGMTETISHIALQKLNGPDAQDYFQCLSGISVRTDARGCLKIKADYLGSGDIITNDLVEILSPDRFRWLGREDNVINTGGIKVIPEKVENEAGKILRELGLQNRFIIAGLPDDKLGSKVILILEGDPLTDVVNKRIHEKLSGVLTKYETPKEVVAVDHFAETDTQKIDRKATLRFI